MSVYTRRQFLRKVVSYGSGLAMAGQLNRTLFQKLPSPEYENISHTTPEWTPVSGGLEFCRVEVHRGKDLIDAIGVLRIDPRFNKIRVFHSFDRENTQVRTIEEWQAVTGALAMINGAQYMAEPRYMPVALVICDGTQKGPKFNKNVRGILVAEPRKGSLPLADLLDFDYDKFNSNTSPYAQGIQHWPILLDRKGNIKVKKTDWQANRTVVAKTFEGKILFFTTEGGFFTLYNFGLFLQESNQRKDRGFRVHTAMNMDGGYEANMIVKSENVSYLRYGSFETYGPGKDASIFGIKIKIPGVVGVFPR